MDSYTTFTNVLVTNDLKAGSLHLDIDADDYEVTEDDAAAAAGSAPTKAEFDAVVDLCNEIKEKYNELLEKLC